jgi:hypothetical protein
VKIPAGAGAFALYSLIGICYDKASDTKSGAAGSGMKKEEVLE